RAVDLSDGSAREPIRSAIYFRYRDPVRRGSLRDVSRKETPYRSASDQRCRTPSAFAVGDGVLTKQDASVADTARGVVASGRPFCTAVANRIARARTEPTAS